MATKEQVLNWVQDERVLLTLYLSFAIGMVFHRYWLFGGVSNNNFMIFQTSFINLIHHNDLYSLHPEYHEGHYRYSPTFALLFAPFTLAPKLVGYLLWNCLNAVVLYLGVKKLPLPKIACITILWIIFQESTTTFANAQSNALIAGLMLLSFVCFEKRQYWWGSAFSILLACIKIYGIAVLFLLPFYSQKRKLIGYLALWFVALLALPLLLIPFDQLIFLYQSWFEQNQQYLHQFGLTVMGVMDAFYYFPFNKFWVEVTGMVILLLPLLRFSKYSHLSYRLLFLASVMIGIIIFNHAAESPTYIIAMTGVALWYILNPVKMWNTGLLILALIVTSFSPSDLMPAYLQDSLFVPYRLKAVPCIIIWVVIQYQLWKPDITEYLQPLGQKK